MEVHFSGIGDDDGQVQRRCVLHSVSRLFGFRHPVRTIALMHIEVAPNGRELGGGLTMGLTNLEVDSIARFKASFEADCWEASRYSRVVS